MNFCVSPGVRRIRYHDPEKVSLRTDLPVMYVTPSIVDNHFHKWLRESFSNERVLAPKETITIEFEAKSGWYDILAPEIHGLSFLVGRAEGVSEVDLELFDGQMLPEEVTMKIGPVRARVHSNLDSKVLLGLGYLGDDNDEHPMPNWKIAPFLTGKRLLTSQTFHRLFKAESIEVGTGMQIKSLTVLFTDLQASTAMYERVGDLNALGIVRRHFEVLEASVARHRGSVVKTIGDAVMAVFAEADQAMVAAAEMIETVRQAVAHGEDLVLKIGLHSGPCVAIQSNNQIDYFGRTVNIAARIQNLAGGGEIVCSEDVWKMPGVSEVVQKRGLAAKRESAALKGIGDRFAVRRVRVMTVAGVRPAAPPRARKATNKRRSAATPRGSGAGRARPAPRKKRARAS